MGASLLLRDSPRTRAGAQASPPPRDRAILVERPGKQKFMIVVTIAEAAAIQAATTGAQTSVSSIIASSLQTQCEKIPDIEKPDPSLFETACRTLGASPAATIMVGDSPLADGGAVRAGLCVYLLPGAASAGRAAMFGADRGSEIRGLARVLDLVGVGGRS
jgi:beta-phosphoglucomutase-like phosphatase (HAD superfamily)